MQVIDERELSVDCLVLQVKITWGINAKGIHTFYGVRRRAVPPAPLGVRVDPIADQSAQAVIEVPSPAGESIYSRYNQASPNDIVWGE